jgi:hypothetical protein
MPTSSRMRRRRISKVEIPRHRAGMEPRPYGNDRVCDEPSGTVMNRSLRIDGSKPVPTIKGVFQNETHLKIIFI